MDRKRSASKTARWSAAIAVAILCSGAPAAEHRVKMLTTGPAGELLVFDPMFLKVAVGDEGTFVPADSAGHLSVSVLVPSGATPWKGLTDREIKVKLDRAGVYLVECDLHRSMGMVAVIQA